MQASHLLLTSPEHSRVLFGGAGFLPDLREWLLRVAENMLVLGRAAVTATVKIAHVIAAILARVTSDTTHVAVCGSAALFAGGNSCRIQVSPPHAVCVARASRLLSLNTVLSACTPCFLRCTCAAAAAAALQAWLEVAWQAGFDPGGAAMFGAAVQCSRKWIGTTEAAALLRYFGCRALIVDFYGERGARCMLLGCGSEVGGITWASLGCLQHEGHLLMEQSSPTDTQEPYSPSMHRQQRTASPTAMRLLRS
jgi:hypothetical protein